VVVVVDDDDVVVVVIFPLSVNEQIIHEFNCAAELGVIPKLLTRVIA